VTDQKPEQNHVSVGGATGFFRNLFGSILRDLIKLVIIFALGTLGGAVICLYYGFPLVFSVVGGISIFAFAVAAFMAS
jgi:hypothetical protein